jgi:hypothetical protein
MRKTVPSRRVPARKDRHYESIVWRTPVLDRKVWSPPWRGSVARFEPEPERGYLASHALACRIRPSEGSNFGDPRELVADGASAGLIAALDYVPPKLSPPAGLITSER